MKRIITVCLLLTSCSTKKLNDPIQNPLGPKLSKPTVRKIWVPQEIRNGGTEWVDGHYMYRIEKDSKWSR